MKFYQLYILTLTLTLVSSRSYPLFKQCDGSWGNNQLGSGPDTICKAGCLISSISMVLSSYGKLNNSNPGTVNTWLKSNGGFSGELFVWGSVQKLGLSYAGKVSAAQAQKYLDEGKVVILNVRNGGHWVLATSRNGNTFNVNDPGFTVSTYTTSDVTQAAIYSVSNGFLQQAIEAINNFVY